MITITRHKESLYIRGHAGYAEYGKDIVCAAISALLQTFIASVEELTEDEIKYSVQSGDAVIEHKELTAKANLLLVSFFIGLNMIADEYPQHVKILTEL